MQLGHHRRAKANRPLLVGLHGMQRAPGTWQRASIVLVDDGVLAPHSRGPRSQLGVCSVAAARGTFARVAHGLQRVCPFARAGEAMLPSCVCVCVADQ